MDPDLHSECGSGSTSLITSTNLGYQRFGDGVERVMPLLIKNMKEADDDELKENVLQVLT